MISSSRAPFKVKTDNTQQQCSFDCLRAAATGTSSRTLTRCITMSCNRQVQGPWWMAASNSEPQGRQHPGHKEHACGHVGPQDSSIPPSPCAQAPTTSGSWPARCETGHEDIPTQNAAQSMRPSSSRIVQGGTHAQPSFICTADKPPGTGKPPCTTGPWWMAPEGGDAAATAAAGVSMPDQQLKFARALSQTSRSHASSSPSAASHPAGSSPSQPSQKQRQASGGQRQDYSNVSHGNAEQVASRASSPEAMDYDGSAHGGTLLHASGQVCHYHLDAGLLEPFPNVKRVCCIKASVCA